MVHMATAATLAALAAPAAAFVPTGQLRATSSSHAQGGGQAQVEQTSTGYVGASLAAAAVVAGAAAMRPRGRTACNSQFFPNKQRTKFLPTEKGGPGRDMGFTELGCCYPIDTKFDPLNLGNTDAKMDRYTQVEIKHGRIAMIATVGYIMPEIFRFPGCEDFKHGLAALNSIPLEGWVQLVALIGAHEVLVKPREGGMGPSDFGQGVELLENLSDFEIQRKQTVERNNGRLAMVAILGMMWQDGQFGKTPILSLSDEGWWGPGVQFLIEDLPACAMYRGASEIGPAFLCAKPQTRETSRIGRRAYPLNRKKPKDMVTEEDFPGRHKYESGLFTGKDPDNLWAGDLDAMVRTWDPEPEMSPAVPFLRFPYPCKGYVGGEKGFDPLNITDTYPVYLLREAELKHGRIAMLATVGWIAVDLGARFPGEKFQTVSDALSAHDIMVKNGYMEVMAGMVLVAEVYGYLIAYDGWMGTIDREAGDYFVGKKFLPSDPAKAEEMQLKELENGRLAMLAISGIVTGALITGKTWPFLE